MGGGAMADDPGYWSQNWEWITTLIGLVIMAVAVAVSLYLGRRQSGVSFDGNALIEKLLSTQSERDTAQYRVGQLETDLETKEDERKRAQTALEDLLARQAAEDPPPGIDDALRLIDEKGDSAAAEGIFRDIAERKKKEGAAAHQEAARALRNLGALAFLHDSEKALAAYGEAVQLDPDDADGWNQLGHLRYRIGQLDGAFEAYERVLSLGNRIENKAIIASATGNLGNLYYTQGDLEKAEEYHLKSLALDEALGRKEGMANQYGNLGNLYYTRSDLEKAEKYYLKSLALEEALGRKEGIASDYGNLGNLYYTRGDLEKAEEYYLKSLVLEEALGRKEGMANAHTNLGILHAKRGDMDLACENWAKALDLFTQIGIARMVEKVEVLMREAGCCEQGAAGDK